MVTIKSAEEIGRMRRAGRVVAEILALMETALRPGVTGLELDALARAHMKRAGVAPSFLNYLGNRRYGRGPRAYPATICVSFNEQIVHGIPSSRRVRSGDLVSVDVAVAWQGWHADAARTWLVGEGSADARRLAETTHLALMAGIAAARPGNTIEDISAAVEAIGRDAGFDLVVSLVGHGIGSMMHEDPNVPNVRTGQRGLRLSPGMCLAIEPMLTVGRADIAVLGDHWTVVTSDGSLAAHFEHTVAITDGAPEILTTLAPVAAAA